jgi:hypothetical protein
MGRRRLWCSWGVYGGSPQGAAGVGSAQVTIDHSHTAVAEWVGDPVRRRQFGYI